MSENLSEFGSNVKVPLLSTRNTLEVPDPRPLPQASTPGALEQWRVVSSDTFSACSQTRKTLTAGMYMPVVVDNLGICFKQLPIMVDELLDFPGSANSKIVSDIKEFWANGEKFQYYGYLQRRGFIFYGPAGGGKSCLIQQIIKNIVDDGGLVMLCNTKPAFISAALGILRQVEAKRPLVCLFEDIDAIIEQFGESELLALLDGENQLDLVLNIATTNYPEKLDKRIVSRPRRFDRVIKIDWPDAAVRKVYFKKKLKIEDDELDKWVAATDRMSFAACADLVISVKCLGQDFEHVVTKLRELNRARLTSASFEDDKGTMGFARE
jgi:hypothetical protein